MRGYTLEKQLIKLTRQITRRIKKMARAAKDKKEVEVSLETVLWNCRVALRGVGTTEKNRDAVIGLVFLKFTGDKFEKRRKELQEQYGDIPKFLEKPSFYNAANVFYLKETARWSYIVKNASANNIAVIIDQAMADIEESNPPLKGALTLNLFATLGADKSKIKDLIDNVNQIDEKRFQEEDLIGRVYEYFLQIYAASGTKEDGEFYTPACVVKLIAEMIEPYSGVVYDPCCGSGGMFVQSMKFVDRHNGNRQKISVIGQESQAETWRLCKMNLAIRGIAHNLGEKNASTFTEDLHKDKKVDFIMANPPFNLSDWGADKLQDDVRWKFGIPPSGNAKFAWLQHMIHHLSPKGKIGMVLANGSLSSQTGGEGTIRENIIKADLIEGIVALPSQLFYTTGIPVSLWFLNREKKQKDKILFVDARNMGTMVTRKLRELQEADIKKIADTFDKYSDGTLKNEKGFCAVATLDDVAKQDYILPPGRYVGIAEQEDDGIPFQEKMDKLTTELSDLFAQSHDLEDEIRKQLASIGFTIK